MNSYINICFNHAPSDYKCPICLSIQGIENNDTLMKQTDLVFKDDLVTVFMSSFFIGNNPGHVIVVPNEHFESIYNLPVSVGNRIFNVLKKMAVVLKKAYSCEGVTILQNNEPSGDQHAFHYHLHIFPRYANDNLHQNMGNKKLTDPLERKEYAEKLKEFIT